MDKYANLKIALLVAMSEANKHAGDDDGGTCNFDSPALAYSGMKKSYVLKVLDEIGLRSWDYGKRLVICGFQSGQGDKRTNMSEAFRDSMKQSGYDCSMYYQMD